MKSLLLVRRGTGENAYSTTKINGLPTCEVGLWPAGLLNKAPKLNFLAAAKSAETADSDSAKSEKKEGTWFRSCRGTEQLEGMLLTIVAPA